MADQVDRLASTANYMGYDALSVVYDDMAAVIGAFTSRSTPAGADDIEAFLQSILVSGIGRIQELFPNAKELASIDTTALALTPGKNTMPEQIAEPFPAILPGHFRLAGGFTRDDDEDRESLLSKTLDETFSSMRTGDNNTEETGDAQSDVDPIALQFSSEADGSDDNLPESEMDRFSGEAASTILDDFGSDRNDHSMADIDGSIEQGGLRFSRTLVIRQPCGRGN